MQANRTTAHAPATGFSPTDILYIVFRHKWKILVLTLIGLGAAATVYLTTPPLYKSQAKLLVRYVVERNGVDEFDSQVEPGGRGAGTVVMQSEIDIIKSWDVAEKVAETLGPKSILPDAEDPSIEAAASAVMGGLSAESPKLSHVIVVSYSNENPEVSQRVLRSIVDVYLEKHIEVHRSVGAYEFVSQRTDQMRLRLRETSEKLAKMKKDAGILSLSSSLQGVDNGLSATQQELLSAEAALAAQQARVDELSSAPDVEDSDENASDSTADAGMDSSVPARYKALVDRLSSSRRKQFELLARYTPQSEKVRINQAEIASLESQRRALESEYPALAGSEGPVISPAAERAALAAAQARVEALKARLASLQKRAGELVDLGQEIEEMERKQASEAQNYQMLESSLEKARIDEMLDPSRIPNISEVQEPSPPVREVGDQKKILLGLAGGGLALGLGIAFLIEMFLDKSVRRSFELEKSFGIRQMISIPELKLTKGKDKALAVNGDHPGGAPWDKGHSIRGYSDAIRDQLVYSFEMENVTHKPKMVGVTGCNKGAGVTTLACSLAASLSETGDGKVLLVDVNTPNASAHPFLGGRPAQTLDDTLQKNGQQELETSSDNLYVATVSSGSESDRFIPKNLFKLMPKVRASDFDYIIFDMPPVGQMSPTATLGGFMDKMLFVVESEKSNREVVKRAHDALVAGRADVLGVVNKARPTVPHWIESHA